jgi:hypothetical protein
MYWMNSVREFDHAPSWRDMRKSEAVFWRGMEETLERGLDSGFALVETPVTAVDDVEKAVDVDVDENGSEMEVVLDRDSFLVLGWVGVDHTTGLGTDACATVCGDDAPSPARLFELSMVSVLVLSLASALLALVSALLALVSALLALASALLAASNNALDALIALRNNRERGRNLRARLSLDLRAGPVAVALGEAEVELGDCETCAELVAVADLVADLEPDVELAVGRGIALVDSSASLLILVAVGVSSSVPS